MFFKKLSKGILESNTYVLGHDGEGVVIDPGNKTCDILSEVKEGNLNIKYIILTHTHMDHIYFVDELQAETGAEVVAHKLELPGFSNSQFNVTALMSRPKTFREPDILVDEGDTLTVGGMDIEFIHTPGHTPGSMCVKIDGMLFSGDTVFDGDFGRTDLPYGQPELMKESVDKVFALASWFLVYPGHGTSDTIKNIIIKSKVAYNYI